MGIDTPSAKFLCAAKSLGVDFTCTATIGRQAFYPDVAGLRTIFALLNVPHNAAEFLQQHEYAEEFFRCLGAHTIDSLDYSSYEGATILHDMNAPIADGLKERYSLVHDGGTLEHVFNVPQAVKNCMEMVRVGGHFSQVTVANNFLGHGFWQFSPELIYRVFSAANGYRVVAVLLHEVVTSGAWYVVRDPDAVRSRVELCNSRPTYILTIAKRIAAAEIFATPPQQSDYVVQWAGAALNESQRAICQSARQNPSPASLPQLGWGRRAATRARRVLAKLRRRVRTIVGSNSSDAFARPYYRRIQEAALLRGTLDDP